jgi:hypothetical protein
VIEGKHAGEGWIPRDSARMRVGEVVMLSIMAWQDDNGCQGWVDSVGLVKRVRIFPSPCQGEDRR